MKYIVSAIKICFASFISNLIFTANKTVFSHLFCLILIIIRTLVFTSKSSFLQSMITPT